MLPVHQRKARSSKQGLNIIGKFILTYDLMGKNQRGEITEEEFSKKLKGFDPAWQEAETEAERKEEEREELDRQIHECKTFVWKARRLKITDHPGLRYCRGTTDSPAANHKCHWYNYILIRKGFSASGSYTVW